MNKCIECDKEISWMDIKYCSKDCKRTYEVREWHIQKGRKATLKQDEWALILYAFDYKCAYCEKELGGTNYPNREHLIPFSKGGEFTWYNIVPSCQSCNKEKSDIDAMEWVNSLDIVPYHKLILGQARAHCLLLHYWESQYPELKKELLYQELIEAAKELFNSTSRIVKKIERSKFLINEANNCRRELGMKPKYYEIPQLPIYSIFWDESELNLGDHYGQHNQENFEPGERKP